MLFKTVTRYLVCMSGLQQISENIKVEAQVKYLNEESNPSHSLFVFSYRIKITNQSSESVQLLSRHWIITDNLGQTEEVKGPGVVGIQPKVASQGDFQYESLCPLTTSSGSMKGFFHFVTESGTKIQIPIPEFYLISPLALH